VCKPDPAIYTYAAQRIGSPPESIVMVGDSLDRDIKPAKSIGMQTAWVEGPSKRPGGDSRQIDIRVRSLVELPAALERCAAAARTVA
jgi:putative hydrolase of the HAD superfamily